MQAALKEIPERSIEPRLETLAYRSQGFSGVQDKQHGPRTSRLMARAASRAVKGCVMAVERRSRTDVGRDGAADRPQTLSRRVPISEAASLMPARNLAAVTCPVEGRDWFDCRRRPLPEKIRPRQSWDRAARLWAYKSVDSPQLIAPPYGSPRSIEKDNSWINIEDGMTHPHYRQ